MQISQSSDLISNVRSTLRDGLAEGAHGTSAKALAASQTTGGDPLFPGTPNVGSGADSFDRTVTTTTDDITITVNVARVQKGGVSAADASGPAETGETVHLEIKTIDDSLSGKQQKIIVDPTQAANANISGSQLAGIESDLVDGTGVYAGNVTIDDQRTITQKVDQTLLEPDATGKLQSVQTSTTQTETADYAAVEKSRQAFDATAGSADTAESVAGSLIKTFSSSDWLGANIPGLHISAQA